jgi:peptide/nickel transport system substrate-binding protein
MGAQPMPAHKVAGQDFNKLWADSFDIASGAFKFQSWQKGTQLSIVKNAAYRSGPSAKLDRIVFRYIAGASQFQALKSGEGDVVEPQPQVQIVDFYKDNKFKVQVGPSYQWEHLDFQQGAKAHPALKKKFVRQAIATGINRAQIREVLYVKTGLVPNLKLIPVLQSNIYKPFEAAYKPAYSRWKFSQRNAIALLKKNGCTGGPDTPSGSNSKIFSCPGVGQLSFAFTTTSGNPLRALTFEIIQRQLKSVGIEFTPRFISPAVLFGGGTLTSGDWQAVMFTFLSDPTGPGTFFGIAGCGGDQNYGASCNRKASRLLQRAQYTADEAARNKMLQQAEVFLADEVFSIPLFSRPAYLLNSNRVRGPVKNPTLQGSTWNAELWSVTS